MCYIVIVNPIILSEAGMDKPAVFTATVLAGAIGSLLIGVLAKLPLGLAPGMGMNAFFAYTLVLAMGYSWQMALAAVFLEGIVFIIITLLGIRNHIIKKVPTNISHAITVGIGMFIALIGLKNAGIINPNPTSFGEFNAYKPETLLGIASIFITGALYYRNIKGSMLISIVVITLGAILLGATRIPDHFSPIALPPSLLPGLGKMDFSGLASIDFVLIVIIMCVMDIFSTMGSLMGAASQGKLLNRKGELPGMKRALLSDAIATTCSAALGSTTVTTFVESIAGISQGARSGLAAVVTSLLFILALFLAPLFSLVPSFATTGVLFMIGVMMMSSIRNTVLEDYSEAIPAFITIVMTIFTFSIAEGISLGIISFTIMKLLTNQRQQIGWTLSILTTFFVARYVFMTLIKPELWDPGLNMQSETLC
jgi:AGZA family xanthine/uracil permease-like MFS transporter